MVFLIVKDKIIRNVIEAEQETAQALGACPYYNGAGIGQAYNPPQPPVDEITALQLAVAELAETQTNDQTANELALTELAEIVLGGQHGTDLL